MERLLAVVFDNEAKAYEGLRAINQLDAEGSVVTYAAQVIQKGADGKIAARQTEGNFPLQTSKGLLLGSLIGILGGPVGLAIGASVGTSAGAIGDLNIADLNMDFVHDVASALTPGKVALVADVDENWVTPVDTRMEPLGGIVFRTPRRQFEAEQRSREIAELKAEISDRKAEIAQARADRKARLQAQVDEINNRLEKKLQEAKQRSEQVRREAETRVEALRQKAATAQGENKKRLEERINRMREDFDRSTAKFKTLAA